MSKKFLSVFLISIFTITILFFIDVGINSKYFIIRDFSSAFEYRRTGDCDAFREYITQDQQNWHDTCEYEKQQKQPQINSFRIQSITHKFGSNRAFLQVEISRIKIGDKYIYNSLNYEMKRVGMFWKIDQLHK